MAAERALDLPPVGAPADLSTGSIFFIGNATVLLRYAGFTILTDPTFIHRHEKVDLGYGIQAERLTDPAIEIADLPPLDLILLSHFHGDHFDQVAEARLDRSLPIVTTGDAARQLAGRGFHNTHPLETWDAINVTKGDARLRITALPGRHGPGVMDIALPDVMGSLLELGATASARLRIYITGDTLVFDDIQEIPRRFPEIHLALLHLGGTEIFGIMVTMDAAQGVEMLRIVDPEVAIPIHYDDYNVFKSSLADFRREVTAAGLQDRVHYLQRGETYRFTTRAPGAAWTEPPEQPYSTA